MYTSKIYDYLSKNGISVGDIVSLVHNGRTYIGHLLENPSSSQTDILLIKLNSGYNVGLRFNDSLSLVEKFNLSNPSTSTIDGGSTIILMYGGTVASKVEYVTGAVYPSITPREYEFMFPNINRWGKVGLRLVRNILSEDMSPSHWENLADSVYSELKDDKPVVITHGTDTMSYSSAALSFAIQNPTRPIVFTGAQRSSDRSSSDSYDNLMNSVFFAQNSKYNGVYVLMHSSSNDDVGVVISGVHARKMHTSRRDAFKSINSPYIAHVNHREENITYNKSYSTPHSSSNTIFKNGFNDNVAMIYIHPGIKPSLISKLSSYDGVVLVGTGLGHVPVNPFNDPLSTSIFPEIKSLIESDIPVVMSSQAIYGRLNQEVYTAGRLLKEIGVIGHLCNWTPEVAFAKLSWLLAQYKGVKTISEKMAKNYVGECTERSLFL